MTNPKMTTFLYLLMKDEVVPGRIQEIIQRCEYADAVFYGNNPLGALAEEMAKRLE